MADRRKSDKTTNLTLLIVSGCSIALSLYAIYTVHLVQSVASGIRKEMMERARARGPLPFGEESAWRAN